MVWLYQGRMKKTRASWGVERIRPSFRSVLGKTRWTPFVGERRGLAFGLSR